MENEKGCALEARRGVGQGNSSAIVESANGLSNILRSVIIQNIF